MKATIVIPNWNGAHLLRKNLSQVINASRGSELIVVDDASTDDSVVFIRENFPNITVLQTQRHSGFPASVNMGVKYASGDIIVLLNTDVVPENNFLLPLLSCFDKPDVFAVGCLEKSHEQEGIVQRGRGIAKWIRGFYVHRLGVVGKNTTAWVSGGSGAFRRQLWLNLGGLDEMFSPFYWEDIDISYRALKSGYTLIFEKESVVHHYHDDGAIKSTYTPEFVTIISYRNQLLFVWKNLSNLSIWVEHLFWLPIQLLRSLVMGRSAMLQGFLYGLKLLPSVFEARRRLSKTWKISDKQVVERASV